jgi:hypothetical protein
MAFLLLDGVCEVRSPVALAACLDTHTQAADWYRNLGDFSSPDVLASHGNGLKSKRAGTTVKMERLLKA